MHHEINVEGGGAWCIARAAAPHPDPTTGVLLPREIRVGVRDLLGVFFHPKDLSAGFSPAGRAQEGTEGHQLVVSRRPAGYRSEVPIEFTFEWGDYRLIVRGRIDGLLETDDTVEVEEVKTTYAPLTRVDPDDAPNHVAQLKLYLYFLMVRAPEQRVVGKLTYLNLEDLSERSFPIVTTLEEGRDFFTALAVAFLTGEQKRDDWRHVRNQSLRALPFPFAERRPGQDELMETVAQAVAAETDLFAEAATGIGKTIAVLYPALRRLAESERYTQIFFLTAKTEGKRILRSTLEAARAEGLRLRTVFIEAKGRVCFSPDCECHPAECPYAADYYAKAARVLPELLAHELITPERVLEVARREVLCPFELSLDLSLFADLIVGDYNYVFDPKVYLRRFFQFGNRRDYLFLVDEAHNLVGRGREMYSAVLEQQPLATLAADLAGLDDDLAREYARVESFFRAWRHEMDEEGRPGVRLSTLPEMLEPAVRRLTALQERFLLHQPRDPLWQSVRENYYALGDFLRIAALLNREYAIYVKAEGPWTRLRLFCLNPGPLLRQRLNGGRSAVFFSATLSPFDYFRELLGGMPEALHLALPSPFPRENRLYLHVPGVDTRYRARASSAAALAQCAATLATARVGNYLIFFPSYAYLNTVRPLIERLLEGHAAVYTQHPAMSDAQKTHFLRRVTATNTQHSNVGLAVLGGLFGEGVDLPGEQLVGVLVVGPGLPTVSDEQELIRGYFDERNGAGALFAYVIPGLIRVIQSAGRVFRSPEDRGVALLVDDRFLDERYRELLPPDWFLPGRDFSTPDYEEVLREFWQQFPGR